MGENIDWGWWLEQWDRQQTGYLPDRERRYAAMFDVLEAQLPEEFTAVDLASGPGSLSQRLLDRFPKARCIAVDLDPVLMALGQGSLGDMGGRLRWVEVDINEESWVESLDVEQVDAILSTTALHWLPVERLINLYRQLSQLIRPGGVPLNGDHMSFAANMPGFNQVAEAVKDRRRSTFFNEQGIENWQGWWDALRSEQGLKDLFKQRDRRFVWREDVWADPGYELQVAALKEVGFAEVGTIWQNMDNRVLMAIR